MFCVKNFFAANISHKTIQQLHLCPQKKPLLFEIMPTIIAEFEVLLFMFYGPRNSYTIEINIDKFFK